MNSKKGLLLGSFIYSAEACYIQPPIYPEGHNGMEIEEDKVMIYIDGKRENLKDLFSDSYLRGKLDLLNNLAFSLLTKPSPDLETAKAKEEALIEARSKFNELPSELEIILGFMAELEDSKNPYEQRINARTIIKLCEMLLDKVKNIEAIATIDFDQENWDKLIAYRLYAEKSLNYARTVLK